LILLADSIQITVSSHQQLGSPNNLAERCDLISFTFIFRQTNLCITTLTAATKQTKSRRLITTKLLAELCNPTRVNTSVFPLAAQNISLVIHMSQRISNYFSRSHVLFSRPRALLAICFIAGFLLGLFDSEDGGDVPPKHLLTFNGLQGVLSQNIVLFITTAVRISNPTKWITAWGDHY
jgi:hypothetical protein